jgi:hypothetical protein
MICPRCKKIIPKNKEQYCWYCQGMICYDCWEEYGDCGHKGAEEIKKKFKEEEMNCENCEILKRILKDCEKDTETN